MGHRNAQVAITDAEDERTSKATYIALNVQITNARLYHRMRENSRSTKVIVRVQYPAMNVMHNSKSMTTTRNIN